MIDIRQGDNVTELRAMPDECIDLTVTSPPYDNLRNYGGHTWDFENLARELYRVTKRGGVVVWVVADATIKGSETGTSFRQALYFMECGFNLHDTMIYRVNGVGAKGSNLAYWQEFEYMFILSKGRANTLNLLRDRKNKQSVNFSKGRNTKRSGESVNPTIVAPNEFSKRGNVWTYNVGFTSGDSSTSHPAPFPEALARDHILSWSNEGDTVLDPFAGSGTTLKMAAMLKRNAIGIEIHAPYIEIIKARLAKYETAQTAPLFEV